MMKKSSRENDFLLVILVSRSLPPIPNPFLISRPPPAPVRPTNHPTLLINSFLCPKTHLKRTEDVCDPYLEKMHVLESVPAIPYNYSSGLQ